MKTLKKTLCLVLAVVMAVGVLILPANADMETYEGFQDTDEVNPDYLEAVATLTGMGIISGKSDTAFVPTASVTRAEAASLIVTTLTTPAGRALTVLGSKHPFTDVGEAHKWADANIGYAYEAGIVSGKTDTTFAPNATVTGYELLTMLMKATGYEAKNTSANWKSKAVEFAREYNIFATGLADVIDDPDKALTREETAQMIWRAINHPVDGNSTSVWVVKAADLETPETFDNRTDALLFMLAYNSGVTDPDKKATISQEVTNEGSIADETYNLRNIKTPDEFGRTLTQWVDADDHDVVYSEFAPVAGKVYYTATDYSTALKAVGFKKDNEVSVTVITNGTQATAQTKKVDTDKQSIGGTGTRVEVYNTSTNATKSATIIVIDTYVRVLTKDDINEAKGDNKANITFTQDGVEYYLETSSFAKDQVVIFTAVDGADATHKNIVDMNVAKSFTGVVTASNAGRNYVRVGTEQKQVSAHARAKNVSTVTIGSTPGYMYSSANTEYTYYEDSYGNIIYASTEKVEAPQTDYIYVIQAKSQANQDPSGADDILGTPGTSGKQAIARARVILPETGEVTVIDIAIARKAGTQNYYYKNIDGTLDETWLVDDGDRGVPAPGFHEFAKLPDGTYALVKNPETDTDVSLSKGNAAVGDKYATSTTHLVVSYYNETDKKVTSTVRYDGYANFPTLATSGKNACVFIDYKEADKTITRIYVVVNGNAETAPTPVNYAVYVGLGEYNADGQHYVFYVNGSLQDYVVAEGGTVGTPTANGVYNLQLADGKISSVAEPAGKTKLEGDVTVSQEGFIVVNNTVVYVDAKTVVVDKSDNYALAEGVAVDDTVTIYYAQNSSGQNVAEFIIVD